MASSYTLDDYLESEEQRLRSMRGWVKVLPGLWTPDHMLKTEMELIRARGRLNEPPQRNDGEPRLER
jgi:hypothetical protein